MNKQRIRTAAAVIGTAAVGGVAGCDGQAATQSTSNAAPQQAGRPPGGGSDQTAAALAEELGISEAKVQAALEKVMPQGGGPPSGTAAPSAPDAPGSGSSSSSGASSQWS